MNKDPIVFITHILESIDRIESFSKNLTKEKLSKDELRKSAIIRQLEIIGEAVKNLPEEFTNRYPKIPWKKIVGMRDIVIHQYFDVDLDTLWGVIESDIPDLKQKILKIKNDLETQEKTKTKK